MKTGSMKNSVAKFAMPLAVVAMSLNAHAATIAHWDFESDLMAGIPTNQQVVSHPSTNFAFDAAMEDISSELNHLSVFHIDTDVANRVVYSTEVAFDNQTDSAFSINRFGNGFGWTDGDLDLGGAPVGELPTWTIEASVRFSSVSGWQTIVGKDGIGGATQGGDANAAPLYFQKQNNSTFRVNFIDAAGNVWIAAGTTVATAGPWYHLAATSDGSTLTFYLNGEVEATTDMTLPLPSNTNTAMIALNEAGVGNNGRPYSWSVGRGIYGNNYGDWLQGWIDDVRISDTALETNDMLFVAGVEVEVPPPAPGAQKLWINGTDAKIYFGASTSATNYIVYRSETQGGPYTAITNTTATTVTNSGLTVGTTYFYVITAESANGESDASAELSGTAASYSIFANSDSSWNGNIFNFKEAVFDGDITTFYDSPVADSYVGIDLGEGNELVPSQIKFYPRSDQVARMNGGVFQGSNDGTFWDNLVTVSGLTIAQWYYVYPETDTAYRYIRFSSATAYGNIAEIEFGSYVPGFYDAIVSPPNGSYLPSSTEITLEATVANWKSSYASSSLYLNGVQVATDNTPSPDGTNTISYAAGTLAAGTYTGSVVVVGINPPETMTNTWTFGVFAPFNGSTLYNVNFKNGGTAVTNGTVIVAESTGANQWNNIETTTGNTWSSPLPVVLADSSGGHPINISWSGSIHDFGSTMNNGVIAPLFVGYFGSGNFNSTLDITGLSPAATYDIVVYFTWGWKENQATYQIVEGSGPVTNLTLSPSWANVATNDYSLIAEGVNYVVFSNLTSSAVGSIEINATSTDGGFSGLQIIQHGTGVPGFNPTINSLFTDGSDVTISWSADVVGTYQIQSKSDLTQGTWSPVATGLTGGNGLSTVVPASGGGAEFFRIYGE